MEKEWKEKINVSLIYFNGSMWKQKCGSILEVVGKAGGNDYLVKFSKSPIFTAQPKEIKSGGVKDRNLPSVAGVGYMSYGKYVAKINRKNTPAYEVWRGILRRCYDTSAKNWYNYGGVGITVHHDWHNFQNFAKWYYHNKKLLSVKENTKFDVDKDLKGGRTYSEDNCTLLPYKLNNFIQVQDSMAGDVGYRKNVKSGITTTISLLGKQIYIDAFKDQKDANEYYRIAKSYVTHLVCDVYLELDLITYSTCRILKQRYGNVTKEETLKLLSVSSSFEGRIKDLLRINGNLLTRVRGKVNQEIYESSKYNLPEGIPK